MKKAPGLIIGNVDRIAAGVLTGWAKSAADPAAQLVLDIRVDGDTVMSVCARDRIATPGGHHGFTARLPAYLLDGRLHAIEVVEPASGTILESEHPGLVLLSGRSPVPPRVAGLTLFALFQESFYRHQLGPGAADVADALTHYRTIGWQQGLDPHPLFDTSHYLARYGDVAAGDPLTDFMSSPPQELRETHPLFSAAQYDRMRPDVAASGTLPLLHYIRHGWREGHGPSSFFDHRHYHAQTPGLREAGHDPLMHYLLVGWREGRRPHPDFDPALFNRLAAAPPQTEPYARFVQDLARRPRTATPWPTRAPRISILIPNFNKPLLTLQCLHHLRAHTPAESVEIIVIDNGSNPELFELLCAHSEGARLLRLGVNRGFGEALNIAADQASGDILLFLNNDAYVTAGWLPPLLAALDDPAIGAAGPKFLYPDGRLQECGALIMPCGSSVQRGKQSDAQFALYDSPAAATVDYVSAACMAVRAADFHRAGGFDLCWDPAYYEDVDLCLRLRLMGLETRYVAQSTIVHVENATWSDPELALGSRNVVDANRMKFTTRWGAFLSGDSDGTAERHLLLPPAPPAAPAGLPTLGLFTPHPLTPGGGERYLLTIAHTLRRDYRCTLLTPEPYSKARLATLGRELGLTLDHVQLATLGGAGQGTLFDLFICMGNEVLPPIQALGRLSLYHCQFPFPMTPGHYAARWQFSAGYQACIVNSAFTRTHLQREIARLALPAVPIHVVPPPVPQIAGKPLRGKAPQLILHVGRFAPGGHCKRQDLLIEAFAALAARASQPVELHLAGAIGVDAAARDHLQELRRAAAGLKTVFHVNLRRDQLHELYRRASVYWHMTGAEADVLRHPELFEHFGITIAEAMSAGAIPIALRHGGPAEIVVDGHTGLLVGGATDLVDRTLDVLALDPSRRAEMRAHARDRAARFAPARFDAALRRVLAGLAPPPTPSASASPGTGPAPPARPARPHPSRATPKAAPAPRA